MTTRRRGDQTREAVVEAATRRFTSLGFDGTTVSDIAADAGVAEATIFLHFHSKAGLLVAVMDAYYARLVAEVEELADAADTPTRRLAALVDQWVDCIARDWALTSVFAQQGRFHADEQIAAAFIANNRRVTRIMTRTIDELKAAGVVRTDISTRLLRDAVYGTIEHMELGRRETGRPETTEGLATALRSLLLDGALVRTTPAPSPKPSLADLDRKLDFVLDRLGASPQRDQDDDHGDRHDQ